MSEQPPAPRPGAADEPDGARDQDGPTEQSNGSPTGSPTQPGEDTGPERAAGFDAAFDGEDWAPRERRRRSSGGSSSGGSSGDGAGGEGDAPTTGRALDSSARRQRGASRRRRHTGTILLHVVLALLGVGLAWVVITGLIAAYQLHQASEDLSALSSQITGGDVTGSTRTAEQLAAHAHHAQVMTSGPAWAGLAAVPWLGDPFDSIRGITAQTTALADHAVPGLIAAADDVNPSTVVKNGASVDLAALQRASGPVHAASGEVAQARTAVEDLPSSTWLPFVDSARSTLADKLGPLSHTLRNTDQALQVLPSMLGVDGRTRRYFLAFQNNAELRGTGGLPGAFAIVDATNGTISIERFESDDLIARAPSGLDFGKYYNAHYQGDGAYDEYVDSNESPHFPYAAQIWCSMWHNVTGQQLDGAFTVDPGALSYLLAATGPAKAPDGTQVTADNVVALLQKDVYATFPQPQENDDRKEYILDIAEAVEKRALSGAGNPRKLVQGLAQGVSERRIVAWSADPAVEQVLASAPIGGTVSDTTEPYSLLSINNGAGDKLDYYLKRSVSWERTGCGDSRPVTVTITLTNGAPASGLPPYVTTRSDRPTYPTVPGQNRVVVDYVATIGAQLVGAEVDGQATGAAVFDEEGHPTFRTILELTPGQTRTFTLSLTEPAGDAPLTVVKQPGVLPVQVDVTDRSCS